MTEISSKILVMGSSNGGSRYAARIISRLLVMEGERVQVVVVKGDSQLKTYQNIKREIKKIEDYIQMTTGMPHKMNVEVILGRSKDVEGQMELNGL